MVSAGRRVCVPFRRHSRLANWPSQSYGLKSTHVIRAHRLLSAARRSLGTTSARFLPEFAALVRPTLLFRWAVVVAGEDEEIFEADMPVAGDVALCPAAVLTVVFG